MAEPIARALRPAAATEHPPSLGLRALALLSPWLVLLALAALVGGGYRMTVLAGAPRLHFARPLWLALLGVLPLAALRVFHFARARTPSLVHSRAAVMGRLPRGLGHYLSRLPEALRLCALALLVIALARPQVDSADTALALGIDIVIALDVSQSMSERDIAPDRIHAAKAVLRDVIASRKSDRIGLVIFGREAFTQCPLTLDYHALQGLLDAVDLGLIDGAGTAIGNALATAENRLRRSDAQSKVIILLTDGDNNAGNVSPKEAAQLAQQLGIKVFTILMGADVQAASDENAQVRPRYPVNPRLLEEIAGTTGGTPYLATDAGALKARFYAILDELDRSRIKDQKGKPRDLYPIFLGPALGLVLVEVLLSLTRFRRFP